MTAAAVTGVEGVSYAFVKEAPKSDEELVIPSTKSFSISAKLKHRAGAHTSVHMEGEFEVPYEVIWHLLSNPSEHPKIFGAIQSANSTLIEKDGPRETWFLDYKTRWNFWRVAGVCDQKVFMWTDSDAGTVVFKLREPGFLKVYEGTWTITRGNKAAGCAAATAGDSGGGGGGGGGALGWLARSTANVSGGATISAQPPAAPVASITSVGGSQLVPIQLLQGLQAAASHLTRSMPVQLWHTANPALLRGTEGEELQQQHVARASLAAPQPQARRGLHEHASPLTLITVDKTMCPRITPPYPINHALKRQITAQVRDMLRGLVTAAHNRYQT